MQTIPSPRHRFGFGGFKPERRKARNDRLFLGHLTRPRTASERTDPYLRPPGFHRLDRTDRV